MPESFRLKALKLKRMLKINVVLPKKYDYNEHNYPLFIALDGQFLFNFMDENTRKVNIEDEIINENIIFVSLHSPSIEDWRISELNPYYNGDHPEVDKILAYIYADYIANDLISFLKDKYRINDDIYLYTSDISSILGLYMIYRYDNFKGVGLFLPKIDNVDDKFKNDIIKNMKKDKKIYLYSGKSDNDDYYKIYQYLDKETNNIMLDYNEDEDDNYESIKNHIKSYFDYLLR
jgi:predicted alpha/beta superfamily hydrolase